MPNQFPIDESLLCKAVSLWGRRIQRLIAIEEMSELTKEIIKNERYPEKGETEDMAEEIADVLIMVNQLALMQGTAVRKALIRKQKYLRLLIDGEENKRALGKECDKAVKELDNA